MAHSSKDDVILRQNRSDAFAAALAEATDRHVRAWQTVGEDECAPDLPIDEWSVFRHAHPHALLIGPAAQTMAAVARLRRDLRAPLVHWHPTAVAEPAQAAGTLIVWEVDALDQMQQQHLLTWMDLQLDLQVISVARFPVYPLVQEGAFLDALYYRLNTVCLPLPESLDTAVDAESARRYRRPELV